VSFFRPFPLRVLVEQLPARSCFSVVGGRPITEFEASHRVELLLSSQLFFLIFLLRTIDNGMAQVLGHFGRASFSPFFFLRRPSPSLAELKVFAFSFGDDPADYLASFPLSCQLGQRLTSRLLAPQKIILNLVGLAMYRTPSHSNRKYCSSTGESPLCASFFRS